jgi:hypothetical protein
MRSPFDHQVIDWRQFPGAGTALDARDFRLGISAQVFEATQRGLSKPFKDLDSFFTELDELLTIFNHARNVTQPIRCKSSSITSRCQQLTSSPQVTFPHERLHMDVLYMYQQSSRLLILFHGLAQIRAWTGAHRTEKPWMLELERSGVRFVKQWGVQILHVSQTVLELFFDIVDRHQYTFTDSSSPESNSSSSSTTSAPIIPSPLSSAPDVFFAAILFASSVLLVSRYTMFLQFHVRDAAFVYTADAILEQLIRALDRLARGPGHMPGKAANVVRELQRVWIDKVKARLSEPMRELGTGRPARREPGLPEYVNPPGPEASPSGSSEAAAPLLHPGAYPVSAERGSADDTGAPLGHPDDDKFMNWQAYQPPPLSYDYPQFETPTPLPAGDPLLGLLDPAQFLDSGA